ncbi:MAG: hypothetical protein V7682_00630 [Cycloclasticus sp.]
MRLSSLILAVVLASSSSHILAAPPLPSGIFNAPTLPEGIDKPNSPTKMDSLFSQPQTFNINGFMDLRSGFRTQKDAHEGQQPLNETRLQLELQKEIGPVSINLTSDFIYDAEASQHAIDLDKGKGWIDLREASIAFSPFPFIDIKAGRQVLTWGTGDLIFINDLFPKDWQAFFIGRDLDYLKAPSDAIKTSFFTDIGNIDIVYTPRFDADRGITGEKLSYYNPLSNSQSGENSIIKPKKPHSDEWSMRIYKNFGSSELSLYGYHGFWKSPLGFDPGSNKNRYPLLRSVGASLRKPLWRGITHVELGYYDSYERGAAKNPFTPNSETRFLIGYEQELIKNFTISVQYYLEWMQDYGKYESSLEAIGAAVKRDKIRHVLTNRLSLLTHQQNVTWSLFTFYSPSDADAYLRPNVSYKVNDQWTIEAGGNFFVGEENNTFFAQFKNNNNIYGSIQYGF